MERVSIARIVCSLLVVFWSNRPPQTAALLGDAGEHGADEWSDGTGRHAGSRSRKDVHGALFALRESVEKLNGVLGRVDSLVTLKEPNRPDLGQLTFGFRVGARKFLSTRGKSRAPVRKTANSVVSRRGVDPTPPAARPLILRDSCETWLCYGRLKRPWLLGPPVSLLFS